MLSPVEPRKRYSISGRVASFLVIGTTHGGHYHSQCSQRWLVSAWQGSAYALRHVDPLMTVEAKGKAIMEHANGQDVVWEIGENSSHDLVLSC